MEVNEKLPYNGSLLGVWGRCSPPAASGAQLIEKTSKNAVKSVGEERRRVPVPHRLASMWGTYRQTCSLFG